MKNSYIQWLIFRRNLEWKHFLSKIQNISASIVFAQRMFIWEFSLFLLKHKKLNDGIKFYTHLMKIWIYIHTQVNGIPIHIWWKSYGGW